MSPHCCSTGSHVLVLATFLLGFNACVCSSRYQVLYVKPADNTSCPDTPCHKLSYYVQNPHSPSLYLRSNTTLHFLPGVHTFDHETLVDVRRIENFALVGTWNQSFVWCTKSAGYFFSEVVGLSIQGLVFVDCGIDIAPLNNQLNTADHLPLIEPHFVSVW